MPRSRPEGILDGDESRTQVELGQESATSVEVTSGAKRRVLTGVAALLVAMGATYVVPGLDTVQPWRAEEGYIPFWNVIGRELLGQGKELAQQREQVSEYERLAQPEPAAEPTPGPAAPKPSASTEQGRAPGAPHDSALYPTYQPREDEIEAPKVPIENEAALAHYYGQLTLTELREPGAITRASHWGDSVLGGDGITRVIREQLQARFGDAGHGFHALSRYNLSYVHQGVRFADRGGWQTCQIIFKCERDGHYGYAGVSTESSGGGTSRFRTAKSGFGSKVSRFELWYAERPEGGRFQVKVNGEVARVVETAAARAGEGVETILVPDGEHGFEVRAIGGGAARGYGVVLERDVPGVVWDELSLIGSFTQRLDYQDPAHIARQVKRRETDLLVFMFGGNDVQRQKMDLYRTMQPYEDEYDAVIRKFRAGKPEASCLIMSLVDHGKRVGQHGVQTERIVPKLVESQRKVALARGCAFFDTFTAMGGEGSIGRWYFANPRLANADFAHPTIEGQAVIARLFTSALLHGYAKFRAEREGQPLPALSRDSERLSPDGAPSAGTPRQDAAKGADAGAPAPK